MVKPLRFKGDPKPKKRKHASSSTTTAPTAGQPGPSSTEQVPIENDDTWVTADSHCDINGPVMLVLPTIPPSAIACDGAGKVYRQVIENMVDGMVGSAEPHDVRMVWVANKVAGSERLVRFKGGSGGFLGIDKNGIVTATSEVMSAYESFSVIDRENAEGDEYDGKGDKKSGGGGSGDPGSGKFLIRSQAGQYLKPYRNSVVGDSDLGPTSKESKAASKDKDGKGDKGAKDGTEIKTEEEDDDDELQQEADLLAALDAATIHVRMQARFKPRLQAAKAKQARPEKIRRREMEAAVGRELEDGEVRMLKRARREGEYRERVLDLKVKGKHDKYG